MNRRLFPALTALACAASLLAASPAHAATVGEEVTFGPVPRTLAYGQSFTLDATEAADRLGSTPGTMTFTDTINDNGIPRLHDLGTFPTDASGYASAGVVTPLPGDHWYWAQYAGRDMWGPFTGTGRSTILTVTKAPVHIAVTPLQTTLLPLASTFQAEITSDITGKGVGGVPVTMTATSVLGQPVTCTATTDVNGFAGCRVDGLTLVLDPVVNATSSETPLYLAGTGRSN